MMKRYLSKNAGRSRFVLLSTWLALACDEGSDGTSMRASFELEENECGDGALDVSDEMDFDVAVYVSTDEIEWTAEDVNTYLSGVVSGDSFLMTDSKTVDQGSGCVVNVTSRYVGNFELVDGSLSDLKGELTIEYDAADEGACSGLIGASTGFRSLPCDVIYSFDLDPDD